ncbi:MAG: VOC family protein [Gammaproteobacteria bacterium]|nr:VOC family protein [Gammaproteobacteria bacterium]MCZ6887299.1 VOC family protein [Gammaproteobacteria bacterium]
MADEIPAIIHHVSIGTNNFDAAIVFYDTVLETIGAKRKMDFPGAVAYGKQFPEFWVQKPMDDSQPAAAANGVHFAFIAPSREDVEAFHAAALSNGGSDDGAPGPRPDYGPDYYGCFVRDLDGHKIEAAIVVM